MINAEDVDTELVKIAATAGKAISDVVSLSLADEDGKVRWTPDRFIAMEMSYTNAVIQRLCEATQDVVSNSVMDMLKASSEKVGSPDMEQLKGYLKDLNEEKKKK